MEKFKGQYANGPYVQFMGPPFFSLFFANNFPKLLILVSLVRVGLVSMKMIKMKKIIL